MNIRLLTSVVLIASLGAASGQDSDKKPAKGKKADMEKQARLQVFLDRANFGPGKIDGRDGEFTNKALERYRKSQGATTAGEAAPAAAAPVKKETRPEDLEGLDLASVDPVFISYTVTKEDMEAVGELPEGPEAKAKLKYLPYVTVLESVAEKFHSDMDFLKELNPEIGGKELKEGDTVTVPNVEPFDVASVKALKPGELAKELGGTAPNESEDAEEGEKSKKKSGENEADSAGGKSTVRLRVSTADKMVEVFDGEKMVAAFPVTPGSGQIPTPTGDWKVRGVAKMPEFRHDEKMLKEGERSKNAHMLPPGPNSPVGVVWIALNKKGIGLHGTDDPETIGRAASHGCVRLANWDVVKLAKLVKGGVAVVIE